MRALKALHGVVTPMQLRELSSKYVG